MHGGTSLKFKPTLESTINRFCTFPFSPQQRESNRKFSTVSRQRARHSAYGCAEEGAIRPSSYLGVGYLESTPLCQASSGCGLL